MPDYRRQMGGARWTPKALPGLLLWLDATDDATITTGTGVSAWADKSGNGNACSQATGTAQPTRAADAAFGGQKVLAFNPANAQRLTNAAMTSLGSLAGVTAFYACRLATTSAERYVMHAGAYLYTQGTNAINRMYQYVGGGGNHCNYAFSTTTPVVIESVYDGTQTGNTNRVTQYVSGAAQAEASGGTVPATIPAVTGYTLGSDGTRHWSGEVAEVLIYSRALSVAERARVRAYLGGRYRIAVA